MGIQDRRWHDRCSPPQGSYGLKISSSCKFWVGGILDGWGTNDTETFRSTGRYVDFGVQIYANFLLKEGKVFRHGRFHKFPIIFKTELSGLVFLTRPRTKI